MRHRSHGGRGRGAARAVAALAMAVLAITVCGCLEGLVDASGDRDRIRIEAALLEGDALATVLFTVGDESATAFAGELTGPPFVLDLPADGDSIIRLRAYGYDEARRLRWVRYWEGARMAPDGRGRTVVLDPLPVGEGWPLPPPYPDHHLTTGFRPFMLLDTLRTVEGIPLHFIWGHDEPVISRHWIDKVILSNFENWVLSGADSCRTRALFLTDWLLARAEPTPLDGIAFAEDFDYPGHVFLPAPWNGAFTQGLSVSVLVRAHILSGDERYLDAAAAAMRALTVPVGLPQGVAVVQSGGRLWFEEYPSLPAQHTLNGAVYCIFSVLDYWHHTGDPSAERCYRAFVGTLERDLPRFDTGSWSYYDLWGVVATESYHQQHINQLGHLHEQTGLPIFDAYRRLWQSYQD